MPAVIEGLFPLVAPGRSRQSSVTVDDSEPAVGVSVSLRLEQQDIVGNVNASSPILAGGGMGILGQVNFICKKLTGRQLVAFIGFKCTGLCSLVPIPGWALCCVLGQDTLL